MITVPRTDIKDTNVSGRNFDYLVYIVFDKNYDVIRAYGITVDVFQKKEVSRYVEHTNSHPKWRFHATPELLKHPAVDDLTEEMSSVQ